jgi:hypothetical protein
MFGGRARLSRSIGKIRFSFEKPPMNVILSTASGRDATVGLTDDLCYPTGNAAGSWPGLSFSFEYQHLAGILRSRSGQRVVTRQVRTSIRIMTDRFLNHGSLAITRACIVINAAARLSPAPHPDGRHFASYAYAQLRDVSTVRH